MSPSAHPATLPDILPLRQRYRQEMNCQIIHDSIHSRPGWTNEFLLRLGDAAAGYGSIAVAGPWKDCPALYEFYLLPYVRNRAFDLFETLLGATRPVMIETQSNAALLTTMLHAYATSVETESVLFEDALTTTRHAPADAAFRPATPEDAAQMSAQDLDPGARWLVECQGHVAAAGDILFHYNPPYGDIYMATAEPFRRLGLASYLVQELKRIAYETGRTPAARCNPKNLPSRKTLQQAGFVPCGHILHGVVAP